MTNEKFDALFGGTAAQARGAADPAPHGSRGVGAGRHRGDRAPADARRSRKETGAKNLCLAGGVALNCVANGKLLREDLFDGIWVQPAAGDAGGALGAASPPTTAISASRASSTAHLDGMARLLSRPGLRRTTRSRSAWPRPARRFDAADARPAHRRRRRRRWPTRRRSAGSRAAWSSGRARSAPARSWATPRSPSMQKTLNLKVKYREIVPALRAGGAARGRRRVFRASTSDSPYMLMVAPVNEDRRRAMNEAEQALFGIDKLNVPRSDIPAVTHVDYSARIQTVHKETNPRFHALLVGLQGQDRLLGAGEHLASTCAASRSSARPRTPSAASWAARSRCWWSATASSGRKTRTRR